MRLVNCVRCGKAYEYNGISNYCPICMRFDEENFKMIKEYLYEHPKATVLQVAGDLDISVKMIKRYLREGRLEIIEAENFFLECEQCGTSIKTGRYCEKCMKYLDNSIKKITNEAAKHINQRQNEKMRYLDKAKVKQI